MTKRDEQTISALEAVSNKIMARGLSDAEMDRIEAAHKLFRRILDHYRDRPKPCGQHGGFIGSAGEAVLCALIENFWYGLAGPIEPSYAALAWVTGRGVGSVRAGVSRLKELGIIEWETSRASPVPCRLKLTFATTELPPQKAEAIGASRMNPQHAHLNRMLDEQ
jgi:hypothetical protein